MWFAGSAVGSFVGTNAAVPGPIGLDQTIAWTVRFGGSPGRKPRNASAPRCFTRDSSPIRTPPSTCSAVRRPQRARLLTHVARRRRNAPGNMGGTSGNIPASSPSVRRVVWAASGLFSLAYSDALVACHAGGRGFESRRSRSPPMPCNRGAFRRLWGERYAASAASSVSSTCPNGRAARRSKASSSSRSWTSAPVIRCP